MTDTSPVLVVGTFDTKRREIMFVANRIRERGVLVRTVDISTLRPDSESDISAAEIAAFHPDGPSAILLGDRGQAMAAMGIALERFLVSFGRVSGLIGLGGSGGTAVLSQGFRALPVGLPKMIVSTVASGDARPYIEVSDLILVPSVTDVAGLNRISREILRNAADAMAGMAIGSREVRVGDDKRPAIGLTMFGVTTPCVDAVVSALDADYDCLVFHATGVGGRTMEKLVDSGLIDQVIDISTTEVADLIVGGVMSATDDRFGAIERSRVPFVGSLGACDMGNFGSASTVPDSYRHRLLHIHNPHVTLMRTNAEENAAIGTWIAERLNRCSGEVRLIIPEGGLSVLDAPGMPFFDPEANSALFAAIEETLVQTRKRRLIRSPLHINDPAFALLITDVFRAIGAVPRASR